MLPSLLWCISLFRSHSNPCTSCQASQARAGHHNSSARVERINEPRDKPANSQAQNLRPPPPRIFLRPAVPRPCRAVPTLLMTELVIGWSSRSLASSVGRQHAGRQREQPQGRGRSGPPRRGVGLGSDTACQSEYVWQCEGHCTWDSATGPQAGQGSDRARTRTGPTSARVRDAADSHVRVRRTPAEPARPAELAASARSLRQGRHSHGRRCRRGGAAAAAGTSEGS